MLFHVSLLAGPNGELNSYKFSLALFNYVKYRRIHSQNLCKLEKITNFATPLR